MKQLAVMKNIGIGCRDIAMPCLYFDAYTDESTAALQVLSWEQAFDVIKKSGHYDFKSLEGSPCWVEVEHGIMRFLGICKI